MATENEKKNVTGLDQAANRKDAEYDLITALLSAADYKTSEDCIEEIEMMRKGKYLFTVHIHPLSDNDLRFARKKATTMMPNPNNKKLPQIEKEHNLVLFKSWCIYLATTEEDQQKIWGQPAVMQKLGLTLPVESIDAILTAGEKDWLFERVGKLSDMNDEENGVDEEDEVQDEETFLS